MNPPGDETPEVIARSALWRAARTALVLVVVASVGLAVASQVTRFPDVDLRLRPQWLLLSVLCLFLFAASHIEIWRAMLARLGVSLDPWTARSIFNASLLARYVPTGILSFLVRVNLADREGVGRAITVTTLVYELGLSIGAALLVAAYFVVDLPSLQGEGLRWSVVPLALAAVAALHPRVFPPLASLALRRLGREPLRAVLPFRQVLGFTLAYVAGFLMAGLGVYAFARGLQAVPVADVPVTVGSYSIGFVAGLLGAVLPGGLGAREGGLAVALSPVLSAPIAVAVAVGTRVLQIGIELGYAALSAYVVRRARSRVRVSSRAR